MADGIHVLEAWLPTSPTMTNGPGDRNPDKYLAIIRQFDIVGNPRYTPRNGTTFCNIFLWDVTKAMGAEIPHWVINGVPDSTRKGKELNANAVCDWLNTAPGKNQGWVPCSAGEAVANAKLGCPAIVTWKNPTGIGHVGVVIPSLFPGVRIAQAGGTNFFDGDVTKGFGTRAVSYFKHS